MRLSYILLPAMVTAADTLRNQLIGSWSLVTYHTELLSDPTNKTYPLGPDARGLIVYTPDGYMSAQVIRPGQAPFEDGGGVAPEDFGTDAEWAEAGRRLIAYSGRFFTEEEDGKAILSHELDICSYPRLAGQIQRRIVSMEEVNGVKYLNLGVDKIVIGGEERAIKVRWTRAKENTGR